MATGAITQELERAPVWPMLREQSSAEFKRRLRVPQFLVFGIVMPVFLYLIFGLTYKNDTQDGVDAGRYILASLGAYGMIGMMLSSFGAVVSVERAQRLNILTRTTPLRPIVDLLAKVFTAIVFGLGMQAILFAIAFTAGDVRMPLIMWVKLAIGLTFASLPFIGLGYFIGYAVNPSAAGPLTGLLNLILGFASGLFITREDLPRYLQRISPFLPTTRYGELAWSSIGATTQNSVWSSVAWIVGYSILFGALATWAYRRDEVKTFV
jgi:ABC-2 type transport system permease protein